MISKDLYTAAASFVAGGGFVALLRFITFLIRRSDARPTLDSAMDSIAKVYDELSAITRHTSVKRAMVAKVTNGGTVPELGKQLYTSILYESVSDGIESVRGKWQKQALDPDHIKILLRAKSEGVSVCYVHTLHGALATAFEVYGIFCSQTFALRSVEGAFYYLALHYDREPDLDAPELDEVRQRLTALQRLFAEAGLAQR